MAKQFPLVVHYSFDGDVPVWLFDRESEALAEMQKQVQEEAKTAKENWGDAIEIEHHVDLSNGSAVLKEYFQDHVDETTWAIGSLKN